MISKYNQIDFENDTVDVINAKIKTIKQGVIDGVITQEEMLAEKEKLDAVSEKVGYAFNW